MFNCISRKHLMHLLVSEAEKNSEQANPLIYLLSTCLQRTCIDANYRMYTKLTNEITRLPCSLVPVEEMIKKTHVMVNAEFE